MIETIVVIALVLVVLVFAGLYVWTSSLKAPVKGRKTQYKKHK